MQERLMHMTSALWTLFHPNPGAAEIFQRVAFPFLSPQKNKTEHISISCSSFVYPQYLAASTYLVQISNDSEKEKSSVVKALDGQAVLPM